MHKASLTSLRSTEDDDFASAPTTPGASTSTLVLEDGVSTVGHDGVAARSETQADPLRTPPTSPARVPVSSSPYSPFSPHDADASLISPNSQVRPSALASSSTFRSLDYPPRASDAELSFAASSASRQALLASTPSFGALAPSPLSQSATLVVEAASRDWTPHKIPLTFVSRLMADDESIRRRRRSEEAGTSETEDEMDERRSWPPRKRVFLAQTLRPTAPSRTLGTLRCPLPWREWTWQRRLLWASNWLYTIVGVSVLVGCLLVWFRFVAQADVFQVMCGTELRIATTLSIFMLLNSLLAHSAFLRVRTTQRYLAIYTFLLWPCLALAAAIGYISYIERSFRLEQKLNQIWRRIGLDGRLTIQANFACCGYNDPSVESALSPTCWPRSQLPGCKAPLLRWLRPNLYILFTLAFTTCGVLFAMIGLYTILANSTNPPTFGRGVAPMAVRRSVVSSLARKSRSPSLR